MNIVIVGASDIGVHLARILSQEQTGIILIDKDQRKLENLSRELDISIKTGSGTDWTLLEEIAEINPDLILALTEDDETNLVTCSIAKNLGYPRTIARIRQDKYLNNPRLSIERLFCVDYLISPEKLTAESIANLILIPGSITQESFAHGAIKMRTMTVSQQWSHSHIKIADLDIPKHMMVGLIKRSQQNNVRPKNLIFPHGDDTIKSGDEVTFIGESSSIDDLPHFLGTKMNIPDSLVIIGGSLIGIHLAKLLESRMRIKIIEKDYNKCKILNQRLPNCTILNHDGIDLPFLRSEKIGGSEALAVCTRNDEINLLAGTLGKELGCQNVIISLSDINYIPIVKRLGIHQAASPRINAANRILSIIRERTIASMVSLYDNQAEVMEVKVSMNSKIAGIPIRDMGPELPTDFLLVAIQSRGRVMIATGNHVLTPGDTVIVISNPKHVAEIKKLF